MRKNGRNSEKSIKTQLKLAKILNDLSAPCNQPLKLLP